MRDREGAPFELSYEDLQNAFSDEPPPAEQCSRSEIVPMSQIPGPTTPHEGASSALALRDEDASTPSLRHSVTPSLPQPALPPDEFNWVMSNEPSPAFDHPDEPQPPSRLNSKLSALEFERQENAFFGAIQRRVMANFELEKAEKAAAIAAKAVSPESAPLARPP